MMKIKWHSAGLIWLKFGKFYKTMLEKFTRFISVSLLMVLFVFCSNHAPVINDGFPYDLNNPDKKYSLPGYLEEISGMAFYKKNKLICIQDEKANIYVLDLEKGKIESQHDFGKDADFEDITLKNKTAYILRSNGDIYKIEEFWKSESSVKKYETSLSENNDTEGLAYDQFTNSLLIACKGSPLLNKDDPYKGNRAIYRFDLEKKELVQEPAYLIDLEDLNSYKDHDLFTQFSINIAKRLNMIESETSFKPSGIAIHPVYGEIYIIANVGKLLIVLDRHGKITSVKELDIKIFRQPEGICFSPSGDLFISNEGKGGKGNILKFKLKDNE